MLLKQVPGWWRGWRTDPSIDPLGRPTNPEPTRTNPNQSTHPSTNRDRLFDALYDALSEPAAVRTCPQQPTSTTTHISTTPNPSPTLHI